MIYESINVIARSASDEAIHSRRLLGGMDCFAALAMTEKLPPASFRGARSANPESRATTSRFRIGPSDRPE